MKPKSNILISLFVVLLCLESIPVFAAVKLPAMFGDGMVLQQQSKVALWGWAKEGEDITITQSWDPSPTIHTKADSFGKWKVMLSTPAAGGPYVLTIKATNIIQIKDVMIGEVWLCSGQSNMVFSLKSSEGAKDEIAKANFPSIRYFSVKRQYGPSESDDCPGSVWEKTTPSNAPGFSAVAYYFAKKIHLQKNVPVGIIYSAWGGTPAEAWTPSMVINNDTVLQRYLQRWEYILQNVGKDSVAYHLELNDWQKQRLSTDSMKQKVPAEPQTLYYFKRPWREPSVLFNGMICPVIPFGIKGVLWYQGESNVAYADEYSQLFGSMIQGWRQRWQQAGGLTNIPFYFVQLAPYGYNNLEKAARLRQAQEDVTKQLKGTGMAVTIDLGNMKDIHFTRKKEVGERLALIALHQLYGFREVAFAGPNIKKLKRSKEGLIIEFDQKLQTTNTQDPSGFEIGYLLKGTDSLQYMPARATVEKNKLIVWSDSNQHPAAVRYAWLQIGTANLISVQGGLPVAPFSRQLKKRPGKVNNAIFK